MKITQPITVAGYYRQNDGLWQSATLITDGSATLDFVSGFVGETPHSQTVDLVGIETAIGSERPIDPATLAGQCPAVTDFRSSDIAMGGQGAPLHPFYLHALARSHSDPNPLAYLLIDDAISVVWVNPKIADPTDPKAITCFEAGPGLGPVRHLGEVTGKGQVADGALELFLDDPYFRRLPPKRVDPTSFAQLLTLVNELDAKDAYTTLLGMVATAVLLGLEHLPAPPSKFILAGEGANNPLLRDLLQAALETPLETAHHPETIHAQSIAYLAVRVARGLPTTAPNTTGVAAAVGGGTMIESS